MRHENVIGLLDVFYPHNDTSQVKRKQTHTFNKHTLYLIKFLDLPRNRPNGSRFKQHYTHTKTIR